MTTPTLAEAALLLHQITPALSCRDPRARALAGRILDMLAAELPPETIDEARQRIAAEVQAMRAQPSAGPQPDKSAAMKQHMDTIGPKLWAEWHTRALTHPGDDTAYLASMARRLPCGECVQHFLAHLGAHPPVFGAGYFAWTVELHNLVRTQQGKPTMSVEEARALYQR